MAIWFRIEYDDADKYKIVTKVGKVEFTSDLRYTKEELPAAILELSGIHQDDES